AAPQHHASRLARCRDLEPGTAQMRRLERPARCRLAAPAVCGSRSGVRAPHAGPGGGVERAPEPGLADRVSHAARGPAPKRAVGAGEMAAQRDAAALTAGKSSSWRTSAVS